MLLQVQAACIKFVATFRSQFTAEQLEVLLPMLIPFTGAESYVVHTYAASAIERLLMVRDRVDGPGRCQCALPYHCCTHRYTSWGE